jgi:hypothetical protein
MAAATEDKLLMVLDCDGGEPNFASWNQIGEWLKRLDALRQAA